MKAVARVKEALVTFFFAPASPRPLAALRITLAATLLGQAWLVSGDLFELYGSGAVLQESLTRYLTSPRIPRLSWFLPALEGWGLGERQAILGLGLAYVVSLVTLMLGLFTRASALAAWFLHWVLMNTGYATNYGADVYAHVFLFYLVWIPSGGALSLDALRKGGERASDMARLGLRVVQLHLAIAYLASGIGKAQGPQWWNGEVIWRALNLPVYLRFDMTWLADFPWLAMIFSLGTLVVEIFYIVFIWPRLTRRLWILTTVSLHLGIALFLGLEVFGVVMACFTLSLFGVSAAPRPAAAPVEIRLPFGKVTPNQGVS